LLPHMITVNDENQQTRVEKLPAKGANFLLAPFQELWHEVENKNPLKRVFFVSQKTLTCFRYFTLVVNIITFFWALRNHTDPYHHLLSYLTIWGFLLCFAYSIMAIVWADAPDDSLKWKTAYIIGEVGFALELTICPFFFVVLFPEMLKTMNLTFWDIFYQIMIHFIVPMLIWLEIIFSDMSFPKGHRIILHLVTVAYLVNNVLWTVYNNKPVYGPVDWISTKSYILTILATSTVIGGFSLGSLIYQWKKRKFPYSIQTDDDDEEKRL